MTLPLPKVVADVGPGGSLVTSMRGMNALANDMLQNKILGVQAEYAPLTTQADAMSKMAYARLMGPQFAAKMMGNENILANMPEDKKNQALQILMNAGMGQVPSNMIGGMPGETNNIQPSHPAGGFLNKIMGGLSNVFSGGQGQQQMPPEQGQMPQNPMMQMLAQQQGSSQNALNFSPDEIRAARNSWLNSPEAKSQYQSEGMLTLPPANQLVNWHRNHQQPQAQFNAPMQPNQPTWAENVGGFEGIKSEGKKSGELRAQDINDLSNTVFSGQTKQETLDSINKIISSPEFEQIRQTPILGHNELSYYQRYGTPAQQNMVGQLVTLSGNVIRDASQDFKGAFRKGEQQLIQNMKINPGDTFDAARGKMEQLTYLNKMITERARLTGQLMQQHHISKLEAEGIADKHINGDDIRSHIHNTLNPKPTDDDINFMMDKHKISKEEVIKRLKEKGIL